MLKALADGETDPAALASLTDKNLRATPAQLCDALGACAELNPVLPSAAQNVPGGVAADRPADWATGQRDGDFP